VVSRTKRKTKSVYKVYPWISIFVFIVSLFNKYSSCSVDIVSDDSIIIQ